MRKTGLCFLYLALGSGLLFGQLQGNFDSATCGFDHRLGLKRGLNHQRGFLRRRRIPYVHRC